MMFVTSAWSFYLLRFLLGLAEAGFFPGIILYLSYWFPARRRAHALSRFLTGSAITGILGGPLSGAILQYLSGAAGLAGWQWLFLLEGQLADAARTSLAGSAHEPGGRISTTASRLYAVANDGEPARLAPVHALFHVGHGRE